MNRTILPLVIFTEWLAAGERGISSEAIVSHLTATEIGDRMFARSDHPHDPSDFRRCEVLLRQVPVARVTFPDMASRSPHWAVLVEHWDDLVALMEEENPGIFDRPAYGRSPRTYALMNRLFAEVTA
jgi:hypothetical protein